MIQRKVLFPLIEDSLMFEDLPLFIKYMARKEIVSNSNFFYFEVVRVCLFVCCNGVCKFGLSSTKTKSNDTIQQDTRGFNAAFSH